MVGVVLLLAGCSGSSGPEPGSTVESVEAPRSPDAPRAASPPQRSDTVRAAPAQPTAGSTPVAAPVAMVGNWKRLSGNHLGEVEADPATGAITIMPRPNAWYQSFRGGLLFRDVDGDFAIRTSVTVSGRGGRTTPQARFSLAGLLVRSPDNAAGSDNFVSHTLGIGSVPARETLCQPSSRHCRMRTRTCVASSRLHSRQTILMWTARNN